MTAINLPGQTELPIVVDHKTVLRECTYEFPRDVQLAKLLRSYEDRPSSETWSKIQNLAAEILK